MTASGNKPKIIVVCGPTAIGKTAVGIALAEKCGGEIISADSMQVYKYMNIGTAKPTPQERARIPHHLVDVVEPDAHFDAVRYASMARKTAMDICRRHRVPIIVGGTGLYIKALLHGLFPARPIDAQIRERLQTEAAAHGSGVLHARLARIDPEAAAKLHPNDTYRIVRALETMETTGKSITLYHRQHGFADAPFDSLKIGLHMNRQQLYKRINQRVDLMLAAGLLAEVKALLDRGYSGALPSMRSIGYQHMLGYIEKRLAWEEAVRTLKRDTRRYAKRQLTWFGADPDIIWQDPEQLDEITTILSKFLAAGQKK